MFTRMPDGFDSAAAEWKIEQSELGGRFGVEGRRMMKRTKVEKKRILEKYYV